MSTEPMKPSEALRKARELITPEGAWTQGTYAKSKFGREIGPCSSGAICWCSLGSLQKVTNFDDVPYFGARKYLQRATSTSIPAWQDDRIRTHAEVLEAFDRAANLAEAEDR